MRPPTRAGGGSVIDGSSGRFISFTITFAAGLIAEPLVFDQLIGRGGLFDLSANVGEAPCGGSRCPARQCDVLAAQQVSAQMIL
jgi:hypothetical protein